MRQGEFERKVAIVTGSASGIGAAVAISLAEAGARVVINYSKSEAEAHETATTAQRAGGDVRVVRGDVSSDADCCALFVPLHPGTRMGREEAAFAEAKLDIPALVSAGVEGAAEEIFDFPAGAGSFPPRPPRTAPIEASESE